jgi:hypothetical protein
MSGKREFEVLLRPTLYNLFHRNTKHADYFLAIFLLIRSSSYSSVNLICLITSGPCMPIAMTQVLVALPLDIIAVAGFCNMRGEEARLRAPS